MNMSFLQRIFGGTKKPLADHNEIRKAVLAFIDAQSWDEARRVLAMSRYPISLDRPVGNSEDSHFGDLLPDTSTKNPAIGATHGMLRNRIAKVLKTLSYREREIIKLRYGLGDGYSYTLEEVGHIFKVTRERIRQIEAKAVRKLQQPSRSQELVGFLD